MTFPMQIKRKPTAWLLLAGYVVWTGFIQPVWNLNVEHLAQKGQLDTAIDSWGRAMSVLAAIAGYIPSSFGLGFVVGALIFAYWDNIASKMRLPWKKAPETEAPVKPTAGVWVGKVEPFLNNVLDEGVIKIFVSFINSGIEPVTLRGLRGHIIAHFRDPHTNAITKKPLTKPVIQDGDAYEGAIPQRTVSTLTIHQFINRKDADRLVASCEQTRGATLDLRGLSLVFVKNSEPDQEYDVPLWEGICLKQGGFIGSCEIYFLDAKV